MLVTAVALLHTAGNASATPDHWSDDAASVQPSNQRAAHNNRLQRVIGESQISEWGQWVSKPELAILRLPTEPYPMRKPDLALMLYLLAKLQQQQYCIRFSTIHFDQGR